LANFQHISVHLASRYNIFVTYTQNERGMREGKGEVVPVHVINAYMGSGGLAVLLKLGTG
jgi:hypothetical protein